MIDLFSGLGGASEAFVRDGWTVIRIENNMLLSGVPHTRMLDISRWQEWLDDLLIEISETEGESVSLIWASPPCREFTQAYSGPIPRAKREGREFTPDLTLMEAAYDIICRVRPKHWVIENVVGAIEFFTPELGPYTQKVGPFVMWGRFPYIGTPPYWKHSKFENDTWSTDPLRANRRGYVPIEISDGLLQAISMQSSLYDWA
jgi:hypothetical protein